MAVLLALYLALAGWRAVQFILTGEPVAVIMGVALIVLPIIAAWGLWRELSFGWRSQELVKRLDAEGGLDLGIAASASGRADRTAATEAFPRFKDAVEASPESWRDWMRLGIVYDAAGDRKRGREAVRTAIRLSRPPRSDDATR
ncbi:tetratricopeptide repeat protein [Agromyces seonyuensis]|nr:hypothetical protein [Agromyces seonyuensis]